MDEEPVVYSPRNQFLFTTLIVPQPSDSSVPNIVNEITEREVSPTLTQRNDRLVPLREEAQPLRYSTIIEHCPKTQKPQLCVPRVLPASPFEEASVPWCITFDCVFPLRYPTHQQTRRTTEETRTFLYGHPKNAGSVSIERIRRSDRLPSGTSKSSNPRPPIETPNARNRTRKQLWNDDPPSTHGSPCSPSPDDYRIATNPPATTVYAPPL
jgi:hypothetical protein